MKITIKLMSAFIFNLVSLVTIGSATCCDAVYDMMVTNHLETWEGAYYASEIVPLSTNGLMGSLYCGIYSNENYNAETGWRGGSLVEVYQCSGTNVNRLLSAETNIKGVTPVLQRIGISTNNPFAAYWMLWRHPGNGGLQKYTEYAFTNNCLSLVRHLEYGDMKPNHWYEVENEDVFSAAICPPISNFQWYANETIWENTNTIYRSHIGWP